MDADVSMISQEEFGKQFEEQMKMQFQEKMKMQFQESLSELILNYRKARELFHIASDNYFSLSKDELGDDFSQVAMYYREIYDSSLRDYDYCSQAIASTVDIYFDDIFK